MPFTPTEPAYTKPAHEVLQPILDAAIKPQINRIFAIHESGSIPVVVYKPVEDNVRFARQLGWRNKKDPDTFPLELMMRRLLATVDPITRRWTERKKPDELRIFLVTSAANFFVNYEPDKGWRTEPGSLDSEMAAAMSDVGVELTPWTAMLDGNLRAAALRTLKGPKG